MTETFFFFVPVYSSSLGPGKIDGQRERGREIDR